VVQRLGLVVDQPLQREGFMATTSLLHRIGADFLKVLGIGEKVAIAAEPFVELAAPGIGVVYAGVVNLIKSAMAVTAASGVTTSTLTSANIAALAASYAPLAIPFLQSIGVSNPTQAQIEAYIQTVVDGLELFATQVTPAPATTTAVVGASKVTVTETS
jgi:hypothetical protein